MWNWKSEFGPTGVMPVGPITPVCSWESRLFPKQPHRVRLLAPVLIADVARLRKAPVL